MKDLRFAKKSDGIGRFQDWKIGRLQDLRLQDLRLQDYKITRLKIGRLQD